MEWRVCSSACCIGESTPRNLAEFDTLNVYENFNCNPYMLNIKPALYGAKNEM
jgi:hypothetical protein